jgi:hypothetical protein
MSPDSVPASIPPARPIVRSEEARAAFEPERTHPAPPDSFDRKAYFDGRVGLLIEQGNADGARVLLGRRAASHPLDPTVYLDAIRAERSVAPEANAWQAWIERGLQQGADIAGEARRLVPDAAMRAFLARGELSWKVLQRQPSSRDARELLRLRLSGLLLCLPERALVELEHDALVSGAASDPALRALCVATLRASALLQPARVAALLPRYAAGDGSPTAEPETAALRALLALAPAWSAALQGAPYPKPLVRFVTLAPVLGAGVRRELCAALDVDLRAQPREYLRCADELAARSETLLDTLRGSAAALAPAHSTDLQQGDAADPADRSALAPADAAIDRALSAIDHGLRALPLRLAGLGALVLGGPLGRALDGFIHRRAARALFAALLARDGVTLPHLALRLESDRRRALRRLARPLRTDRPLALLAAWASAASVERGN